MLPWQKLNYNRKSRHIRQTSVARYNVPMVLYWCTGNQIVVVTNMSDDPIAVTLDKQ